MKETYIGNQALLATHKVGFLASSKIAYGSVLPTLDWATDVARHQDITIVCGCHSKLERQAVGYLLKGHCGIIIVACTSRYPKHISPPCSPVVYSLFPSLVSKWRAPVGPMLSAAINTYFSLATSWLSPPSPPQALSIPCTKSGRRGSPSDYFNTSSGGR